MENRCACSRIVPALMLALFLGVLAFAAAGCVGLHSNPDSELPGNKPASWEGKSLGVPM